MAGSGKHTHQAERLRATRLRACSNTYLDAQGLTTPPDIARVVGLPPVDAVRLGSSGSPPSSPSGQVAATSLLASIGFTAPM